MPTRRLNLGEQTRTKRSKQAGCQDRDHEPAKLLVLEPGVYEHTCSACGRSLLFTVAENPRLG